MARRLPLVPGFLHVSLRLRRQVPQLRNEVLTALTAHPLAWNWWPDPDEE
jgi:hypothetical protein